MSELKVKAKLSYPELQKQIAEDSIRIEKEFSRFLCEDLWKSMDEIMNFHNGR